MNAFKVKVCGITRVQDAEAAAQCGADMIGLIFHPDSPRFVSARRAEAIAAVVPHVVSKVGVFVNEDLARIRDLSQRLDLEYVQLHGDESPRVVRQLQQADIKVIKSFPVKSQSDWASIRKSPADLVLIDSTSPGKRGGTGKTLDWSLHPSRPIPNLVLAGGITEINVLDGIRVFQPWMIDVNSSLELRPGVKSLRKLRRFFEVCDSVRYGTEEIQLA